MQNLQKLTLREIFQAHQGKVSDKWSSYLDEYERLFCRLIDSPISLLEIGVQNGGSMEIWGKYFPNAESLTGCDINEKCRNLTFEDPRIAVIVGDANTDSIQSEIIKRSQQFDIIIDDGSHRSGDIVKSFSRYFSTLKKGGLFLAEDLHCSYWEEFEGGLFDPLSSISFFKGLSDIVNHEHWGISESRRALLHPYCVAYGIEFEESDLEEIQSVEFLNSICVVRKKKEGVGGLGARCRAGTSAQVFSPADLTTGNQAPDQTGNTWSQTALFQGKLEAAQTAKKINDLNALVSQLSREKDQKQILLDQVMYELNQAGRQIEKLKHTLFLRENSASWKLTAPLRSLVDLISGK